MDSLQVYDYHGLDVRTVERDGETWWVLKDVCDVLELSNPTAVAGRLDEDEKAKFDLGLQGGSTNVINESGIYNVILRSDKPEAKEFRRWVTHEVLPQIHHTGIYAPQPVTQAELIVQIAQMHLEQERRLRAIEQQIAVVEAPQEPFPEGQPALPAEKTDYVDSREIAKVLGRDHIQTMKKIRCVMRYLQADGGNSKACFEEGYYRGKNNVRTRHYLVNLLGCQQIAQSIRNDDLRHKYEAWYKQKLMP